MKGSFCNPRDCFNYDEPSSRVFARALAYKGAKRGEAVTNCVENRRRYQTKKVCYVEGHREPTNSTLVFGGIGTILGLGYVLKKLNDA